MNWSNTTWVGYSTKAVSGNANWTNYTMSIDLNQPYDQAHPTTTIKQNISSILATNGWQNANLIIAMRGEASNGTVWFDDFNESYSNSYSGLLNQSFEILLKDNFNYNQIMSSWTGDGINGACLIGNGVNGFSSSQAGLVANRTYFICQGTKYISQKSNLPVGNFQVQLSYLQRGNYGGPHKVYVKFDGAIIDSFTANNKTAWNSFTSKAFYNATVATHTITLQGASEAGDNSAFIDDMQLLQQQ